MLALAMQLVVATKAGLVNYVQGMTNVRSTELVQVAKPILTGPNGYVELLLTPGSYLRMANNTEVVLDNVELANVSVRIVQGVANVEVVEIDDNYPIEVRTGSLSVHIGEPGIYRFGDGMATIIEGKLETINPRITYKKGWQLSYTTNYRARRVSETELTALDLFSKRRSELIAAANMNLVPYIQNSGFTNRVPYWIFSPAAGLYTYMPFNGRRSPYGYSYRGVGQPYSPGRNTGYTAESAGGSNSTRPSSNSTSGSTSSGGGNFNSAGERTFATPAGGERVTPGQYQERKNPSVPAGPPPPMN
jgi:hypothetical protein